MWIAGDGAMYHVSVAYPRSGAAALTFEHMGEGWTATVPLHASASLERLTRAELEELLAEARGQ